MNLDIVHYLLKLLKNVHNKSQNKQENSLNSIKINLSL